MDSGLQAPLSGSTAFDKAQANANFRDDVYRIMISSGDDVTKSFQVALPFLQERIREIQSQPITAEKMEIIGFRDDDYSIHEGDLVALGNEETDAGGGFINGNRDVIKVVINSGDDITESIQATLQSIQEEIQSKFTDGTVGTGGFPSDDESPLEGDAGVIVMPVSGSSLPESKTTADKYTRTMLNCQIGYPLYVPQPCGDFPEGYSSKGVRVGDLGIITKDGAFDFLFNIYPSQNSSINPPNLPSGFTLEISEEPQIYFTEQFPPNTHLPAGPVSERKGLYTSSETGGAVLELPEGAYLYQATATSASRMLALRYGVEWYKYAIEARGRDISNGSLHLVTSCTKCAQWGIAVFDRPCTTGDGLHFVENKDPSVSKYSWGGSSIFTTKVAPSPDLNDGDGLNQCVFFDGYEIKLRQDIFDDLVNDSCDQAGKSLVIAIDIGTTFSGVSYSLLEPGRAPRIQPVTRFVGQREWRGNTKVPSIVCYDKDGNFITAGFEADPELNPSLSDMDGVRRAEWFKLRLCLPILAADERAELEKLWWSSESDEHEAYNKSDSNVTEGVLGPIQEPEPSRPVTDDLITPVQVLADFLRYLFKSAKEYIIETESNIDWTLSWASIEKNTFFVLTHPNGWEEGERSKMREAAIAAGLVDTSAPLKRITFIAEGEASLHFCLDKNPNLRKENDGLLVVDCGGGTIDFSTYSKTEEGNFREITSPACILQGSVFVTSRARDYFKGRFQGSVFESADDVEAMVKAFDKPGGVKCMFSDPSVMHYIKFGGLRDTDRRFGILRGQFRVEGAQVARFFEPAIQDIISGIKDQCDRAEKHIKFLLLGGGFGRSDYLYTRLKDYVTPLGIIVLRLDTTELNKAVADGGVSYYLTRVRKP